MSTITIKSFAQQIGIEPERVVKQLNDAGITGKSVDCSLKDQDKRQLLEYLRGTARAVSSPTASLGARSKITLKKKSSLNIKQTSRAELADAKHVKCNKKSTPASLMPASTNRFTPAVTDQSAKQKAEEKVSTVIAGMQAAKNKEEEEFRQLVQEMTAHNFTYSSDVSRHIVDHELGKKYKHISGILQMELGGNVFDFKGGFPPHIYARLCEELDLRNQGSKATPGRFTPFKDIKPK